MKPLEFKIELEEDKYFMIIYYDNGKTTKIKLEKMIEGFKLNKHYAVYELFSYDNPTDASRQ